MAYYSCDFCARSFRSESARRQHQNDTNHLYECHCCYQTWLTAADREEHEHDEHLYCHKCNRSFVSDNNLRMHLNSRAHRPASLECPFCDACYTAATGLCHHLERGSCPNAPNLNRDAIYRIIRSRDPSGVISNNLIGWYGSDQYEASENSWNGSAYECYLCSRDFRTLYSLNQHLSSPIHQANYYHCPNRGCGKQFTTLAGIMNHLESESCNFMRFRDVQKKVHDLVSSNRLIQF